jgi:hypothetical protein
MKLLRLVFASIATLSLALLVACGDKDAGATAGSARPPASVVDLSQSASALQDLQSFRFDFKMKMDFGDTSALEEGDEFGLGAAFLALLGDISAEGAYVAPDSTELKMRFAGQEMAYIQIGNKAWEKTGSKWEVTTADSDLGFSGSPTELFEDFLPQEALKVAKSSRESINGVNATRYSFDKTTLSTLADDFGASDDLKDIDQANLDIWLTDEGIPVKVSMVFAGKDESGGKMSVSMEMNIRDINKSITIKPPI